MMAASWWISNPPSTSSIACSTALALDSLGLLMGWDAIPSKQAAVIYMHPTRVPKFIYLLPPWTLERVGGKHQSNGGPVGNWYVRECLHTDAATQPCVFWRLSHHGLICVLNLQLDVHVLPGFEMEFDGPRWIHFGLHICLILRIFVEGWSFILFLDKFVRF